MRSLPESLCQELVSQDPHLTPVLALAGLRDPDPRHACQVMILSDQIFTGLSPLHQLDPSQRRLLRYAALLHDIGWSIPSLPHHKASMQLILDDRTIPLTDGERIFTALTARYHRKAHPSVDHPLFGRLTPETQAQVCWAAAILRVADLLDRTHDSRVMRVVTVFTPDTVTLTGETGGAPLSSDPDDPVLRKKTSLLAEVSGREVRIR